MNSRSITHQKYPEFKLKKDLRTMNEICNTNGDTFMLQSHQVFMQKWMDDNFDEFKSILMYHRIGSGKTCTSITMALKYMQRQNNGKVSVILPARLRTNFYDELFSPCVTANSDVPKIFGMIDTTDKKALKNKLKESFEVMSIEGFRKSANDKDLKKWARDFSKNRFIIVDEVHNIFASKYKAQDYDRVEQSNRAIKNARIPGMNTILFTFLLKNIHPTCKLVFLTATPIFDNIKQFKDLLQMMNPYDVISDKINLKEGIEMLRGRVSFFPGASPLSYPAVKYIDYNVDAKGEQAKRIRAIQLSEKNTDDEKPLGNAFRCRERMTCITALSEKEIGKAVSNIDLYCPKVGMIYSNVKKLPGKHVIYSNFVKLGVELIAAVFKRNGWVEFGDPKAAYNPHKVFVVWDGSMKDSSKEKAKKIINSKENIDGKLIRVLIGSPSIKEGVSFKHVQHMHLLDPIWNYATKMQIEGRAIRFCSHADIPENHVFLKRSVVIHVYRTTVKDLVTVDEAVYDEIIPRKYENVRIIENALKEVSFDNILYRGLYNDNKIIKHVQNGKPSPVKIENEQLMIRKKSGKDAKNVSTCPSSRRPDINGNCLLPNSTVKKNKYGDDCCYKNRKSKKEGNK